MWSVWSVWSVWTVWTVWTERSEGRPLGFLTERKTGGVPFISLQTFNLANCFYTGNQCRV